MPLDVRGGVQLLDVHTHNSSLTLTCTSGTSAFVFKCGTDVPHGTLPWQTQPRLMFNSKRPSELQSVEGVVLQAQLRLIGFLYESNPPVLIVFTGGISFVVLQPWGRGIQYWHMFPSQPGYVDAC